MSNSRINALPAAATSASDDYLVIDGATNGTRSLNAYSPTFGGTLTVSGSASIAGNLAVNGTATGSVLFGNPNITNLATNSGNYFFMPVAVGGQAGTNVSGAVTATNASSTFTWGILANESGNNLRSSISFITTAGTSGSNSSIELWTNSYGMFRARAMLIDSANRITVGAQQSSGVSASAWGTNGIIFNSAATANFYRDDTSSGTVATQAVNSFKVATISALSATTYTDSATVYIAGSPTSGTNVTQTNSYGLWNAGATRLDGTVLVATGTNSNNGKIQLAEDTTSAGGIGLGNNTSFYKTGNGSFRFSGTGTGQILELGTTSTRKAYFLYDGSTTSTIINSEVGASSLILKSANTTALTLDSSQRTILSGALRLNNAYVAGAIVSTGYVTLQDSTGTTYKVAVSL